ncbi:hypothetical protein SNEBB_001878 [Seison nebaliae]|nr:hypothetical protein SNEBB_001878 [Seison nebaliae]
MKNSRSFELVTSSSEKEIYLKEKVIHRPVHALTIRPIYSKKRTIGIEGNILNVYRNDDNEMEESIPLNFDGTDIEIVGMVSENMNDVYLAQSNLLLSHWNIGEKKRQSFWKSFHQSPIKNLLMDEQNVLISIESFGKVKFWNLENYSCLRSLTQSSLSKWMGVHAGSWYWNANGGTIGRFNYKNNDRDLFCSIPSKLQVVDGSFQEKYLLLLSNNMSCTFINLEKGDKIQQFFHLQQHVMGTKLLKVEEEEIEFLLIKSTGTIILFKYNLTFKKLMSLKEFVLFDETDDLEIKYVDDLRQDEQLVVTLNDQNSFRFNYLLDHSHYSLLNYNSILAMEISFYYNQMYLATNDHFVKVIDMGDKWNCHLLSSHTSTVVSISLSKCQSFLATGDRSGLISLWKRRNDNNQMRFVKKIDGHRKEIRSLQFSYENSMSKKNMKKKELKDNHLYLVSCGDDMVVNVWTIINEMDEWKMNLFNSFSNQTNIINCVDISYENRFIASASADRSIQIMSFDDQISPFQLGSHAKGIGCCKFQPNEPILYSGSADGIIKKWDISKRTTIMTFEGDRIPIVCMEFLIKNRLISGNVNGSITLWCLQKGIQLQSWNGHQDSIWNLMVNNDEVYSCGEDGRIVVWEDCFESIKSKRLEHQRDLLKHEETIRNLINDGDLVTAITKGIELKRPNTTFDIITKLLKEDEVNATNELKKLIKNLDESNLIIFLKFIDEWNTNSKYCHIAQMLLNRILTNYEVDYLLALNGIGDLLVSLTTYSDRHLSRMKKLDEHVSFIDYFWSSMKMKEVESTNDDNEDEKMTDYTQRKSDLEQLLF